ncbi:PAS domain-containing protein [Pelagibius sp. Alg239-R121]|uniref:PAS domain-containing protein n=1 Tax=Pelagibius sp. Alg239-R121 TaxID=2993448 RepID=UPI0024A6DF20|nr:PAS domain-containing protein [Pelagibius sp. Alg239-R121]
MNPMTEDLPQGSAAETVRPAASLTSSMIKRRRPVRVATPEDAASPQADAPVKAAKELAARVEAAFSEEAPTRSPETAKPPETDRSPEAGRPPQPVSAPVAESPAAQNEALQARQQELRRLAAERAEAQRRPLGSQDQPAKTETKPQYPNIRRSSTSESAPNGAAEKPQARQAEAPKAPQAQTSQTQAPTRQNPPVDASDIHSIDPLRNGQAPAREAPGGRRRSLVQGGMTALERRRAALEQHRKLTEAQSQQANNQPRDIATYWDELRRGRQVPSLIEIDPKAVAQHWPNSLLISCDDLNGAATLERSFAEVMRGAREKASSQGEVVVEYTPMVTEWIMTVGREVARAGRPIQDIEVFPTSLGNVSYRVIALPLSGERLGTVHALCYISHA